MRAARIDLVQVSRTGGELELPPEVTRVADNYNHLHEQPTVFDLTELPRRLAILGAAYDGRTIHGEKVHGLRQEGCQLVPLPQE